MMKLFYAFTGSILGALLGCAAMYFAMFITFGVMSLFGWGIHSYEALIPPLLVASGIGSGLGAYIGWKI